MIGLYFNAEVKVKRPALLDQWGSPVGDPAEEIIPCRLEPGYRRIAAQDGTERVASAKIQMEIEPDPNLPLWYSDAPGMPERAHAIIGVLNPRGFTFGLYNVYVA